jgi:hypothetical protein
MTSPVTGGTPGVGAATPAAGLADFDEADAVVEAGMLEASSATARSPDPPEPESPHPRSASPPSHPPPGPAGAIVVGVVLPPVLGPVADRSVEDGPAQDVRIAAAAMRLRATLFVMPDGTAAAPLRFPEISQRQTGGA